MSSPSSINPLSPPFGMFARLEGVKGALVLAAAAAAISFSVSAASAQECVGGYKMLGEQILVRCDPGSDAGASFQASEPEFTGSIQSGAAVPRPLPRAAGEVNNPQDCQPGGYWYMQNKDNTIPMLCK